MRPKILGHRTGMNDAPENSLLGLKKCFANGAEAVECDVGFNKNGKAIVSLQETANMTLDDIWKFLFEFPQIKIFFDVKFSCGEKSERLEDLFAHFEKPSSEIFDLVNKEIIQSAQEKKLCHRVGFTGFMGCTDLLKFTKEQEPKILTSVIVILPWLGRFPWNGLEKYFPFIDSVIIGWKTFNQWKIPPWNLFMEKIISEAKNAGKKIECGVANTEEEFLWALKNNFDAIWTDTPFNLRNFLIRRGDNEF